MMHTALALAERGLAIFPCLPKDKKPACAHGCRDATKDPDVIQRWWRHEPNYNIGVATGQLSGIFVVDIDGLEAEAELRRLESELGELPVTVAAITARGRHLYFKWPDRPVRNSASKIAPGVDTRGDGGFVVSPPSIHPSGRRYCWSVDSGNAFAQAPEWLLQRVAPNGAPAGAGGATPVSTWRELVTAGVTEGARDCSLARLTGYLLRHRIDPLVTHELLQSFNATRCTPPLPAEDVERIVNSIAGKELRRRQGHG